MSEMHENCTTLPCLHCRVMGDAIERHRRVLDSRATPSEIKASRTVLRAVAFVIDEAAMVDTLVALREDWKADVADGLLLDVSPREMARRFVASPTVAAIRRAALAEKESAAA